MEEVRGLILKLTGLFRKYLGVQVTPVDPQDKSEGNISGDTKGNQDFKS